MITYIITSLDLLVLYIWQALCSNISFFLFLHIQFKITYDFA